MANALDYLWHHLHWDEFPEREPTEDELRMRALTALGFDA
jgi:hypothetical protein